MPDATPVGDQLGQYAEQVAALNQKIDRFFPKGADPVVPDDPAYKALRAQRDVLAGKARDLIATAKKSGASAPDFTGLLRKASAKLKGGGTGASLEGESPAAAPAEPTPSPYLQKFREQYPAYKDVPDAKLADGLYTKFYAGKMSRDEFNQKIGMGSTAPKPVEIPQTSPLAVSVEAQRTGMAPPAGVTGADARALQEERNRLYKQLQAEGVKEPERDPRFQAVDRKYAQAVLAGEHEVAGFGPLADAAVVDSLVRGAGRALGKGVVESGVALGKAVGKGTEVAARLAHEVTGKPAREALEGVRQGAAQRAGSVAGEESAAAAQAGQRTAALKRREEQLRTQQPAVAAQRAAAQTAPPEQGAPGTEGERVLQRTRAQVADLERQYQEAGQSVEQAKATATEQVARTKDAEAAAEKLDQDLLARPKMDAETFGTRLRQTTQELADKYSAERERGAGFAKALDSAGDELRVDTSGATQEIDRYLKDIRNPGLQRVLGGIKSLLTSAQESEKGPEAVDALSVRAADSLRKYLSHIVQTKRFGDEAVDKETLFVVKQLRRELVRAATEAWEPYKEALGKWSTLSRPLDIVERKGGLRKVLETDPQSTDYALTEAEVVGQVIAKARAGSPTLSRLVGENPDLRDAARLYFTQDLFGKEKAPTDAALRTWLRNNETPLKQLGLYDEFRNVRVARETAQRAVDEAKGTAKETMAQQRAAQRQETEVRQRLKRAQALRDTARQRVEARQKAQPTAEELKAQAAKRAGEGAKRLEQRRGEAAKTQERHAGAADAYRRFETELNAAVDKRVPGLTRNFIKRLRTENRIDDESYAGLLKAVNDAEEKYTQTKALRTRLKRIGLVAAGIVGSYKLWRDYRNLLGM